MSASHWCRIEHAKTTCKRDLIYHKATYYTKRDLVEKRPANNLWRSERAKATWASQRCLKLEKVPVMVSRARSGTSCHTFSKVRALVYFLHKNHYTEDLFFYRSSCRPRIPTNEEIDEIYFSEVLYLVVLCRKYTRAPTFENKCRVKPPTHEEVDEIAHKYFLYKATMYRGLFPI
jgi:hypothetical protein